MKYWLMKSEPDQFGIADLARVRVEPWTGVRSMFARFHMRQMAIGDGVLFHHSNVIPPGVAGLARVVKVKVIDETQFDPKNQYFAPKATRDKPIWDCVEVEYVSTLPYFVSLDRMRADPPLADMMVLHQTRLSVQPVTEAEYHRVVALGQEPPPPGLEKPKPKPKTAAKTRPTHTPKPGPTTKARPTKSGPTKSGPPKSGPTSKPTKAAPGRRSMR